RWRLPGGGSAGARGAPAGSGGTKGGKADDEVRTRDIQIGNLTLYQLSYIRIRPASMHREAAEVTPGAA
ncbi:MAG: hypothetical protein JWP04_3205, partial [Belnapia sp.]|nr:hypothetical protein [Belnapia sp.]